MSSTYLGYVQGGRCKDTHAPLRDENGEKIQRPMIDKQFWVQDELALLGIESWCGRRIDFKRVGKRRHAEAFEYPALPNYIFITMTPEQFGPALGVKFLASTLTMLTPREVNGFTDANGKRIPGLVDFKEAVAGAYSHAQRVQANSGAEVAAYKQGDALRVLSGLLQDREATFLRLVRAGHKEWSVIEADVEGRKVTFDPLDVRKAG